MDKEDGGFGTIVGRTAIGSGGRRVTGIQPINWI